MSKGMGLRERKKLQTRNALIAAAMELFQSQGYDRTTVAQIAAAADLSTRTFFLHFPAKEDLLIADAGERVHLALQVIEHRLPGEEPVHLLVRAVDRMITHAAETDLASGLTYTRVQLVMSVPELQARMLQRLAEAQESIAGALVRAYPIEFDPIAIAALIGAVMGAVTAAATAGVRQADPPEQVVAAMRQALGIAVGDARDLFPEAVDQ